MLKRTALLVLIASLCWFGVSASAMALPLNPPIATLFSFSGTRPTTLGLNNDRLAECPSTPNCVNSFSTDSTHAISPISYAVSPEAAIVKLKQTIESLPRTKIIKATDNYIYAEFTSKIMGFVDDVEFYLDNPANVIQVRSASRLGESDLGVNRQRIEAIRAQLKAID
ncbi:DUF1499 domain-containing protein [Leptolyngbya sp. DQ-M1]|uniref:DUF1499 domain-containing protein n=1 Tax=Leptolyngbya sp. DQ-M1 TaxID=2933920 RepID=UPI0032975B67